MEFHFNMDGMTEKELGEKMAKYVNSLFADAYFEDRNVRISKNMKMATGKQDMREYMQFLNIDGKQSYVNLDWTPPMIAPKFMEVLTGGFMKRSEKPRCTATDPVSMKKKRYDKSVAEFRMLEPEFSQEVDEALGKYKQDSDFEPETMEELDVFFNVDYRTPEEIIMERGVATVMNQNRWSSSIKRTLLSNVRDAGYAITYTRPNSDGSISVEVINPLDFFCSFSDKNDFSDASIMGHRQSMRIHEMRMRFAISEDELFEIAKTSKDCSDPYSMKWKTEYSSQSSRPYDEYMIDVLFFEAKTTRPMFWVEKNKGNRKYVEKKKGRPESVAEDKTVIQKNIEVIYCGVYIPSSNKLVRFERGTSMIRKSDPKELSKVYFSYSVCMPDNIGMKNTPLSERISSSVRMITLTHMKIQQLIAKMRPAGIAVDIAGIKEVDLGTGVIKPLELQRVYDQTGNIYYQSVDEDGERKDIPIRELPNMGNVSQLQSAIEVYNFYVNKIRDEVGINEYREGSSVNPKMGLGVLQSQIRESNNATDFIYDAYLDITEQTIGKIGILLHDSVVFGGNAYRSLFEEVDVSKMYFDFKMEMLPDDAEKAYVDSLINTALSNNLIDFDDAFKIRRIDNVKLQELFLSRAKKKRVEAEMQKAQQNSEMNAQIQERSAQAKMQSDMAMEEAKAKSKIMVEEASVRFKNDEGMQKFVYEVLLISFKEGKELHGYAKDLVDGFFQEKARQKQMEEEALAQEQQQAQMEFLAQQGVSPEQVQSVQNAMDNNPEQELPED